jgi:hypothetical protein
MTMIPETACLAPGAWLAWLGIGKL